MIKTTAFLVVVAVAILPPPCGASDQDRTLSQSSAEPGVVHPAPSMASATTYFRVTSARALVGNANIWYSTDCKGTAEVTIKYASGKTKDQTLRLRGVKGQITIPDYSSREKAQSYVIRVTCQDVCHSAQGEF